MRLKTAALTALLIAAMAFIVGVVSLNTDLLREPFNLFGVNLPLAWVLALSLMAGFICFGIWIAVTGIAQVTHRWIADLRRQNERAAESFYLKGLDAVLGSRPLEAISHFQRALEAQPDYLPALLKLGDALRSAGRAEEALGQHRKALSEHPEDIATLYALTEDSLMLEDHEGAKKYLDRILRIQPKRALKALRMLRDIYIKEANWRKALDVQEHIGDARVLDEEREADAPFTPGLLYQIGVDLMAQEKYRDAISHLEKVRKKFPSVQATYIKLAEAYRMEGRDEQAVEAYLDGYRKNASPISLLAMEQLYLDKGDPEGAIGQYQNLIRSTDRKVLPKFLLGRFYYRLEVLEKAEKLFREIEGNIRQSGLLQYYLGRLMERKGETREACAHYRDVIRILDPFELNYRCTSCGDFSPDWKDYCVKCQRWDTFSPTFKDELMQEIQEPNPVFYQEIQWRPTYGDRSF